MNWSTLGKCRTKKKGHWRERRVTKKELGDVKSEVWGEILLQVLGKARKQGKEG